MRVSAALEGVAAEGRAVGEAPTAVRVLVVCIESAAQLVGALPVHWVSQPRVRARARRCSMSCASSWSAPGERSCSRTASDRFQAAPAADAAPHAMCDRCPTGLHSKNWRQLTAKERVGLLPPTATTDVGPGEWAEFFSTIVAQVRGHVQSAGLRTAIACMLTALVLRIFCPVDCNYTGGLCEEDDEADRPV